MCSAETDGVEQPATASAETDGVEQPTAASTIFITPLHNKMSNFSISKLSKPIFKRKHSADSNRQKSSSSNETVRAKIEHLANEQLSVLQLKLNKQQSESCFQTSLAKQSLELKEIELEDKKNEIKHASRIRDIEFDQKKAELEFQKAKHVLELKLLTSRLEMQEFDTKLKRIEYGEAMLEVHEK